MVRLVPQHTSFCNTRQQCLHKNSSTWSGIHTQFHTLPILTHQNKNIPQHEDVRVRALPAARGDADCPPAAHHISTLSYHDHSHPLAMGARDYNECYTGQLIVGSVGCVVVGMWRGGMWQRDVAWGDVAWGASGRGMQWGVLACIQHVQLNQYTNPSTPPPSLCRIGAPKSYVFTQVTPWKGALKMQPNRPRGTRIQMQHK